jgi:hypothetical protein
MSGTGNLTFKNNTFNNGSFGIYSKAMHHIQNVQPQITLRNNTINNAHGIGIFVESFGNAVVFHNNVNVTSVATSASAAAGIVVMKSLHTDSIIGNKLNIVFPNHIRNGVGISISEAKTNATTTIYPSDVSIVMNNIVRISAPSKSVIGILIKNSYYFNVLHNIVDVNSNHDSTAVLCFVDTLPSLNNMFIRNNIFSNSGGGNVLYIAKDLLFQSASNPSTTQTYTNPSLVSNLYYTVGNAFAKFYHSRTNIDSTITSFTDWRNISSRRFEVEDAGSQFARPPYTSTVDLTPNVTDANIWFINGRAEHLLLPNNAGYWNRDYNGIRRPNYRAEGTLDIGAFEVQPMVAPPLATAIPPVPVANSVQKFVMGVDTIATVQWNANPPSYFYLKQYSGEKPPGINHGAFPYFYYEVDAPRNTNNYNFAYAYHDKWTGHFSPFPNVYDRQYYFALKAIQSQTAGLWSFYYGATSTSIDTQANNMFIARPMRVPIANGSGFYSLALDGVNLPVNFLYINATRNLNNAAIIWYVGDEINLKNYQVERSLNGTNYTAIQSIAAKKSNSYTAIDNAIFQNTNSPFIYYRIKAVNNDGSYTYSKVVTLKVHNKTASLTVNAYPNPFIEQFRIAVFQGELKQANGTIILRAIGGTIVKQLDVKFDVGENYFVIDNLSNLPSGYYLLSVHSNGGILTHLLRK